MQIGTVEPGCYSVYQYRRCITSASHVVVCLLEDLLQRSVVCCVNIAFSTCSFLDDAFRKNLESALRFGNPLLVQVCMHVCVCVVCVCVWCVCVCVCVCVCACVCVVCVWGGVQLCMYRVYVCVTFEKGVTVVLQGRLMLPYSFYGICILL